MDQDTQTPGPHERPQTYQCIISQNTQIKIQQGDEAKIRTQQLIKLNTGAKEIQQANPDGPDKQPKHQAPTIPPTDKSQSQNRHRV